jgi:hypothetical protein
MSGLVCPVLFGFVWFHSISSDFIRLLLSVCMISSVFVHLSSFICPFVRFSLVHLVSLDSIYPVLSVWFRPFDFVPPIRSIQPGLHLIALGLHLIA